MGASVPSAANASATAATSARPPSISNGSSSARDAADALADTIGPSATVGAVGPASLGSSAESSLAPCPRITTAHHIVVRKIQAFLRRVAEQHSSGAVERPRGHSLVVVDADVVEHSVDPDPRPPPSADVRRDASVAAAPRRLAGRAALAL